jgi:hypothetical protein
MKGNSAIVSSLRTGGTLVWKNVTTRRRSGTQERHAGVGTGLLIGDRSSAKDDHQVGCGLARSPWSVPTRAPLHRPTTAFKRRIFGDRKEWNPKV